MNRDRLPDAGRRVGDEAGRAVVVGRRTRRGRRSSHPLKELCPHQYSSVVPCSEMVPLRP